MKNKTPLCKNCGENDEVEPTLQISGIQDYIPGQDLKKANLPIYTCNRCNQKFDL